MVANMKIKTEIKITNISKYTGNILEPGFYLVRSKEGNYSKVILATLFNVGGWNRAIIYINNGEITYSSTQYLYENYEILSSIKSVEFKVD